MLYSKCLKCKLPEPPESVATGGHCRFCGTAYAILQEKAGRFRYVCRACSLEGHWFDTAEEALKSYKLCCGVKDEPL